MPSKFRSLGPKDGSPIASQTIVNKQTAIALNDQIDLCLRMGQIHWLKTTAGTNSASQNRCTETSALVGGSQPPLPHSEWIVGMGTCSSFRAPNSNAAHANTNASRRRAKIRVGHKPKHSRFIRGGLTQ